MNWQTDGMNAVPTVVMLIVGIAFIQSATKPYPPVSEGSFSHTSCENKVVPSISKLVE
jgi:hypothetical protein